MAGRPHRQDEPVVVIGSGPSGAVAAARLIERGVDVLLLDSGRRAPRGLVIRARGNTMFRKMGWAQYSTDRLSHQSQAGVMWASSLSNGGLSNFWTAAVPRFAPDDFTEGGRLDERFVWPVGYDDLEPYYEVAERHLTVTAGDRIPGVPASVQRHHHEVPPDWQEVIRAALNNGDGMGALPLAKGNPWMVALRGTEFSSYHCIIRPLMKSRRFAFHRGAHATRLIWSPTEGRVVAVEYLDRETGRREHVRARAVVVAAGCIDSTMLLLRSTSPDFPNGIGNTSGLVGRYLHDHPREWWTAQTNRPMRALAHPLYLARRPSAESEPLMATSHTIGLPSPRQRLRTYYRGCVDTVGVQVFGTMVPEPDYRVELERSDHEVDDRPIITLDYDRRAVANVESSRLRLREVFERAGLRVRVPGPFHELLPGSSVHLAGTVRMHVNPEFGVLDAFNRMHDVPNVVVSDLSCFTTGPEKNPTPTAMALSIRAADMLAADVG